MLRHSDAAARRSCAAYPGAAFIQKLYPATTGTLSRRTRLGNALIIDCDATAPRSMVVGKQEVGRITPHKSASRLKRVGQRPAPFRGLLVLVAAHASALGAYPPEAVARTAN